VVASVSSCSDLHSRLGWLCSAAETERRGASAVTGGPERNLSSQGGNFPAGAGEPRGPAP
jgi:hypothetical protein